MTGPGHVVVAPDKFRGSLTADEAVAAITAGLRRARPGLEVRAVPVADGGEGTVRAVAARGFAVLEAVAEGPTGTRRRAELAVRGQVAVIELAQASGLQCLDGGPAPLEASSRGTGDLLRAALDAGCTEIVVGLGGSACTDGGAGMLQALGARLLDGAGEEVGPGGGGLTSVETLDLTGLDPRLGATEIVLACDVDNPLLGPAGAAAVFGPQKGAGPAEVATLEAGLRRWASLVARTTGDDLSGTPGAGAAGGVGFGALAVLGARVRPGIELLLELAGFEAELAGAALVVTGEGSLDQQSLHGKAPVGVAAAAARHGVPTVAVAGRSTLTPDQAGAAGLCAVHSLLELEPDPAVCMAQAGPLLTDLVATAVAPAWLPPVPA